MQKPKAFSLIELSISIVILSILLAGVIKGISLWSTSKLTAARTLTTNSPVLNIPNLALWLETTSKESFKLSNYGNATSLNSGTWYDINPQELTKNNAVGGASTGPNYVLNGINKLPALQFNGTSQYMTISNPQILSGTDYTIFVVERNDKSSGSGANDFLAFGGASCGTNTCFAFGYEGSTIVRLSHYNNDLDTTSSQISGFTAYVANTPRIHTGVFSTSLGKKYYLNGTAGNSSSSQTAAISNNTALTVGYFTGYYYKGYIGEIIIYRRALRDQERWAVENYLAKKWGITVTQS